MAVKPIPTGYEGATPYLMINDAAKAIEFYKKAFGAMELMRLPSPDGKVAHAEIKIGGAIIMLADACAEMGHHTPQSLGGTPVSIMIYVNDVDTFAKRAIAAGAKVAKPVADQFYGDRSGGFEDPFGHSWFFATHKEDLSPAELQTRYEGLLKSMEQKA